VLTDATGEFGGTLVGEDGVKRLALYRVHGPLRQVAFIGGLYPQDTWSGKHVTYTRHECRGGTLEIEVQSDTALFDMPNILSVRAGGRVIDRVIVDPRFGSVQTGFPLESVDGKCVVRFEIDRTAIPREVTDGENPDPRELGLHFNRFTYRP